MRTKLLVLALWLTTLPLLTHAAGSTWQNATLIENGKTLSGSLSNTNTEGWFKINVTEDGLADLTCTPGSGLSIRYITLFSLVGNELKERGSQWVDKNSVTLNVNGLAAGTYYVRVNYGGGQGSYTVAYNFSPLSNTYADDGEPNNNFSQAKTLATNGSKTGHMGYFYWDDQDTEDWFRINVPEDGQADLTCTPGDGLSIRYITLYSLAGEEMKERGAQWVDKNSVTLTVSSLAAGTYYVRVNYNGGQGGYKVTYKFTPTSNTYADDGEPNNDFSQAKTLATNGSKTGHMGYFYWDDQDTEDWFRINVPEDGQADLTCTPGSGLSIRYITLFSLADGEMKQRGAQWVDRNSATLTIKDLKAGTYYVKVDYGGGQGGYTVAYNFTPISNTHADDKEPNETYTDAKLLRRGHSITGHMGYQYWEDRDMIDWFKIVVPCDGTANLTCTPGEGLSMRYITLYSLSGGETKERGSNWIDKNSVTLTVKDLKPGTYYVSVNYGSGQGGYTIAYDFEQTPYATDQEPNDERQQAISLGKGKTVSGHLGYQYWDDRDTEDWYEVKVSSKSTVNFTVQPFGDLSMRYITLYQGDAEKGSQWIDRNLVTLKLENVEAGTYYVRVNHGGGQGYYFLAFDSKLGSVTPLDPLPADEDNGVPTDPNPGNTWQESDQIVGGQNADGGMNEQKKDAWYKVVVAKDGTAHFTISLDSKLDIGFMELCYLDKEQKPQRRYNNYLDAGPGEKKTLSVNDLAPGTYYLHISRWSGDGKYNLAYRFEPNAYDNDNEPNETWRKATLLPRNQSVTGHLGYQYYDDPDETDWYKINVPRDGKVTLTLTQHDNLDIYFMSINITASENLVFERNKVDNGSNVENKIEAPDVAAGTYYVKVQRYSGPGAYTLSYKFEQNEYANDQETNDIWQSAQMLVDGEPTSGHLGYYDISNDTDKDDWYAIDVPSKSTVELTIRLCSTLDIGYMKMYSLSGNSTKEYSGGSIDAGYGEEKKLTLKNVEPGRYYVCVHRYDGYGHYLIGYNCKVDGVQPQDEPPVEPDVEPGSGGGGSNNSAAGYFFAWLNNGMYTAYPLAHRPKLTMSGTTFTLKTTQTSVTYESKDVLKFTMSDLNGTPLDIQEVFSGRVAPTMSRESDALHVKGCIPGAAITVFSTDGKVVGTHRADANGDAILTLSDLPQGVYIVKSGSATIKITRK
jgi:uncharacterized protein (DUF2141 family)